MEALLLYLMFFFIPGRITIPYVLFWVMLFGMVAVLIISKKYPAKGMRSWLYLLAFEFISLIYGNVMSKWGTVIESLSLQADMILSRIAVVLYTLVFIISILCFCCFWKKNH